MADIKSVVQTPVTLTEGVTSGTVGAILQSLNPASHLYCASGVINHATNDPLDVQIQVSCTTSNTVTGNKQVVIFAKGTIDGTVYGSGPESGVSTTNEADLHYVGSLPMNDSSAHQKVFSLAAAYGGTLPAASKLVFKNDCGVQLTAATVKVAEVWGVAS
jgi:hypothetical protein